MVFTWQDALTFLIGLVAALAVTLGEALIALDEIPVSEWDTWAIATLAGLLAATGRYLTTRIPEWLASRASEKDDSV